MNPRFNIAILLGASVLTACGAPTKSASDVAGLFTVDSAPLQEKATTICNALAARTSPPTTQGMNIDLNGCAEAGLAALDYKKIDSFYFIGLDKPEADDSKVIHTSARAEIWLNKTLLSFASSLSGIMKKKDGGDNTGIFNPPDSADGKKLDGLVTPTIEIVEEPTMDIQNLKFSMKIHLTLSGIVKADHIINIDGMLINNAIAVTIQTTEDREFEQSILKNFQAVLLIVPHASDVYMDMFVDLNVHDIGAKKLFEDQIKTFLSTGMKGVIDSLMQIK